GGQDQSAGVQGVEDAFARLVVARAVAPHGIAGGGRDLDLGGAGLQPVAAGGARQQRPGGQRECAVTHDGSSQRETTNQRGGFSVAARATDSMAMAATAEP